MSDHQIQGHEYVGYEYKIVTVQRDMIDLCIDCMPNFGWTLEGKVPTFYWVNSAKLKFKRDRKIINKVELTRLGLELDSHFDDIRKLEATKKTLANTVAYCVGIVGTAFMAGSVFAVTADKIALCVLLGIPACIGWFFSYFCYRRIKAKKTEMVVPLIESQFDAIYTTCEKANALLYQ